MTICVCFLFVCFFITRTKTFNKRLSTDISTPPQTFFTLLRQICLCLQKWSSFLLSVKNCVTDRSVSESLIHEKREWKGEGGMGKKEKRREENREGELERQEWLICTSRVKWTLEKGQVRHKRKGGGQEEKEKSSKTHFLQSFGLVAENEEK